PLPDEQGTKGFFALSEVELVVADDVVETSTDQTEDHGPHGHVHDGALLPTHGGPSALAPQDRDDDPGEDAQGVEVDVEGPEGKGVDLRAGNGREGAAVLDHALRSCRRQCHCSAALGFAPLAGVASGVLVRIAFLHRLTLDLSGA